MMSDLKFIMIGMKYGANRKMCFITPFLLFLTAIMMLQTNKFMNYFLAGLVFLTVHTTFSQLLNSLFISNLVSSSSKKRSIMIRSNTILNGLGSLNGIILYAISLSVLCQLGRLSVSSIGCLLVIQAVSSIICNISTLIHYKFHTPIVIALFLGLVAGLIIINVPFPDIPFISVDIAILIVILCIVVNCLLSWIISTLIYRYPVSKASVQPMLKQRV